MISRKLLKKLLHLNEGTDKVAAISTSVYVLWQLVEDLLPASFEISHPLHIFIVILEGSVATLLLAYCGVRLALRNPNRRWLLVLSDEECSSLRQWLAGAQEPQFLDTSACKVKFASLEDNSELSQINYEAFLGSAYEASLEQFTRRNAEIIRQNPKCFLQFVDPIGGKEIIGYSCLIPLNGLGTSLYLDGSISDSTLRPELISKQEEAPASVLLFAIHLRKKFSFARTGASRMYSLYFWTCIRLHLQEICGSRADVNTTIDLYVQTQEQSLFRRLTRKAGFIDSGKKSKDGYPILQLCLGNTDVQFKR